MSQVEYEITHVAVVVEVEAKIDKVKLAWDDLGSGSTTELTHSLENVDELLAR